MGFDTFNANGVLLELFHFPGPLGAGNSVSSNNSSRITRIESLTCRNPDSIDHHFQVAINYQSDATIVGELVVPTLSGVGTVPPFDALAALVENLTRVFLLPPSAQIVIGQVTDLVGSAEVSFLLTRSEF